jgi:hypothetical protein
MKTLMRVTRRCAVCLCFASAFGVTVCLAQDSAEPGWTETFDLTDCDFSSTGSNRYFILQPGYQLTLAGTEDGDSVVLQITVLDETETVAGVETRVVEERESVNGGLIEVSRNFMAFCRKDQSVYYFGEDVDMYENGEITGHGGSWRAGDDGNRPGLMMPGLPLLGASYYQEVAPQKAMDRARIISDNELLETPAGRFEHCLEIEETTPLEPDALEYKIHAPGIGLIKEESLRLVSYGTIKPGER